MFEDFHEICGDLMLDRKFEPAIKNLFLNNEIGQLSLLSETLQKCDINLSDAEKFCIQHTYISYIQSPEMPDRYSVLIFYDHENTFSFTALYNRARLLRES